jgi:hypothetical protein
MKKFILILLIYPIIIQNIVKAQEPDKRFAISPVEIIREAKPLIYYGVDLSHVRISDREKAFKNSKYRPKYPPAWITYFEKEMPPYDYIKSQLGNENFDYKQDEIYYVSINVDLNFIIGVSYSFSIDTVKNAVKKYSLSAKSGTGLVLIPENFNKPQETVTTWVVLFDIQKREILYATKTSGHCGHMGYTAHWMTGVIEGFKHFVTSTLK